MVWTYVYTPYMWPMLASAGFNAVLGLYGGRRRSVSGTQPFAIMMLFTSLWALGAAAELAAVDLSAKIFWFKFQFFWQGPVAVTGLWFVMTYAGLSRFLTRHNRILLALFILVGLALILTDEVYHWIWLDFSFDGALHPLHGSAYPIMVVVGVWLTVMNLPVLIWLSIRSPQHRIPAALIACGQFVVRVAFLLNAANINPVAPMDPTILFTNFSATMYTIALFGFRMFNPVPVARKTVIDQMQEGMLVLNTAKKIVDLNPAAEKILGLSAANLRQQDVTKVLPALAGTAAQLDHTDLLPFEIDLKVGSSLRCYELIFSPLKYHGDLRVGHLLLFHDVTDQKHAQAQIVGQQRALATLSERERMARELHDSIGQVLGYASFQLEAANKLITDGQTAVAAAQLNRLAGIIREAHADVREYILNLRSAPSPQQPFFVSLRQYLDGFTNNHGIQTVLTVSAGLGEPTFPPEAQMQVFRILQEALSNTRKHGRAGRVQVTFDTEDHRVRMTVHDDGEGFDPARVNTVGENHFGLQFMRERAEQLGGCLRVDSASGAGTRVVLEVPIIES